MKFPLILQRLDELIRARSILGHPFYLAWQRGELTRAQLATYAATYYPHVEAFPRYLQTALAGTDDALVRAELASNLADERTNPKAHHELWLDFAEAFGLQRRAVASAPPQAAALHMVSTFERLSASGDASALAALYAYESQQPEVSRQKIEGLRQFYGLDDPRSLAYFEVHAEADILHSQGERNAINRCLAAGASPEALLAAADQALSAYWGLLDGVCEQAGIPTTAD